MIVDLKLCNRTGLVIELVSHWLDEKDDN
ncbi:type I toxin-antitoxin system Fst family toxin [Enterococcus faecalis]|uniref:Type I toxin-antitoxin system Fst family toxin n=1 Tax=Enterococcus faecalis TaxID=1351 RepID=A0A8B3RPR6_ENTFL|nr:type I toxin-antitoxin system Fst family toxin [Enterococcus faecalis]EGO8461555.1 type I toxin-antitoxin system Fst family toxin [Enterococcus faecalis]EGO8604410.1 type I toxin-antitoxin system Fst family toxin [Enterococcus faecalis]EGO8791188.1 type I toxin-antitoxin system Fst family toxin [Enterococcus faecalis]EGO9169160.1 type I toxin-antitoxin system Fst family toxin [Enterococcus faecalis]